MHSNASCVPDAGPAEVRLVDVTHIYPGADGPVIADVNIALAAGQMVGLVGPSGSGKSTLLSLVGLLMKPSSGDILVGGHSAWGSKGHASVLRRDWFAWVLQNSACLEARSAVDNVATALIVKGLRRDDARRISRAALEVVGLAARCDSRASQLSGGELQRVTIARALVSGSPFILADEPTGQLDEANSSVMAEVLEACASEGRGVVLATHDPTMSARCSAVYHIANSRVVG